MSCTGQIHSIQSLGAVDGPGIRFVVFFQGCNLRCGCCHNPDTQPRSGGTVLTAEEIVARAIRYKDYFGTDGGITLSGGEPLLQATFAREIFERAHDVGIHTCLDTSGSLLNDDVLQLLSVTDRVLLDIKYTEEELYQLHVGTSLQAPLTFLAELNRRCIPTTLRQVILPTLNDTKENLLRLRDIASRNACVDGVELLPFRKLCQSKYDALGRTFPLGHLPEPTKEQMERLEALL